MRPEPRRSRRRIALAAVGAVALVVFGAWTVPSGVTYAAWSDSAVLHSTVGAGIWAPDPPAACGPLDQYAKVVYGTTGNDTLVGDGQRQILMGYGGDDTLIGGSGGDCLVGGDGNDHLVGGAGRDILLGGSGDDVLDEGSDGDDLIGGTGTDTCIGDNSSTLDCESIGVPTAPASTP